jgi:hypothetical protein
MEVWSRPPALGEEGRGAAGTEAGRRQERRRGRRRILNTATAGQARRPLGSVLRENQGRLPLVSILSALSLFRFNLQTQSFKSRIGVM